MPALAEQLIKSLRSLGVKQVFGIPGGPSIPYLEAMRANDVEFVLVSNEQSAGIMADVTGRLTGIPGVCHATFGPGATNLATGVGGAFLDRSPVIALTTEVKDEDLGRRVQMNIDHQALFKPLTKWTARLSADNFKATLAKAFSIAASEVPGPVHLGLPSNIDGAELEPDSLVETYDKGFSPPPDPLSLERVQKSLERAKKPILAIGLSGARLGLQHEIREFVNKNNIPVLLTPMAKGIIPTSHPCYTGVLFHAQSDWAAKIYRQADLVIGLGYDSVEFNYESWMPPVPLIHIDTEPVDITPEYDVICDLAGNLAQAIAFLNTLALPAYSWDGEEIRDNKEKMLVALSLPGEGFTPARLLGALREVLPAEGILTADVGAHLHLLGQFWQVEEPNRLLMTNGWSSMGYGIPLAIGAKICKPQSPVACVTGDGGFLMNCGELLTARRMGLNVVIIVLCDRYLSLIEVKQDWKKVACYGTALYEGEYFEAGKYLGVPVLQVHDEGELKIALEKAFSFTGPAIIEAVVDGSVYKNLITRSFK